MKELLVIFFICLVIGSIINGSSTDKPLIVTDPTSKEVVLESSPSAATTETGKGAGNAVETTDETFDQDVLASKIPVLVDFSASWCGPCQRMAPVVDELAKEYAGKIKVFKVDIDSNPEIKSRYDINALPTFMVFKNGDRKDSHTGAVPSEVLSALITRQLN